MWGRSYEKIFNDIIGIPTSENFELAIDGLASVPGAYTKSMMDFLRLWKAWYDDIYSPFAEDMRDLYTQSMILSMKESGSDAYNECYAKWTNVYRDTVEKMARSSGQYIVTLNNLKEHTDLFSEMSRSWQSALEQMSGRIEKINQRAHEP